jgi:DNA polymerase-3 subunit alpha
MIEAREVKVSEQAPGLLQDLDWLEARLIPDREMLLGYSKATEVRGQKGSDQGPVVPF